MVRRLSLAVAGLLLILSARLLVAQEIVVPAFTAYADPDEEGIRVDEQRGVVDWKGEDHSVTWFGRFRKTGSVSASVRLKLPVSNTTTLQLSVRDSIRAATASGLAGESVELAFGDFEIQQAGYQAFRLEAKNGDGVNGQIESLRLVGQPVAACHFNLNPRRNAASVHLFYPIDEDLQVARFYTEVTAITDPTDSFYMACGFHRGYFGMQVNSPTERRIIFSIWDAGNGAHADRRDEVQESNRVQLLAKGTDVHTNEFGGEGTGGHSHLNFMWKTGEIQRFLVEAQPEGQDTILAGYYFHPEKHEWVLISQMSAPKDGGYLRGLHSFSENFWGANGHKQRKALYGNQWIQTPDGEWVELTKAGFSHDPTGKENRLDRFMGVEHGSFFLSHGGFVEGFTQYGELFDRPAGNEPPIVPE